MGTPKHTFRVVFALSLLATVFWAIGLAWEPAFGRDAPIAALPLIAGGSAIVICWLAFRNGRLAVARTIGAAKTLAVFVPRLIGAYVVLVPLTAAIVWSLVQLLSSDPNHSEVQLFVWLMAVWFPLWLAPAIGAELSWRAMRKDGLT